MRKFVFLLGGVAFSPSASAAQMLAVEQRIGQLDGAPQDVFGLIHDAAFLAGEGVAVLDSRFQELRIYDGRGLFLGTIARAGRGPGEMFVPEAITPYQDGVALLDRGNARVQIYLPRENVDPEAGSWTLDHEIGLTFQAWDLCSVGNRLFLASNKWETPIVEIDGRGEILNRFGRPAEGVRIPTAPQGLQQSLEHKYRHGRLACSSAGITWGNPATALVRHYSLAGTHRFDLTPPDLSPIEPQVTEHGTVRYGPAPGSDISDALIEVVHLGDEVLIQVDRKDWLERTQGVITFVVDLDTGRLKVQSGALPRVHDLTHDRALSSVTEPFPQLLMGSWSSGS
jgi:hypothetical protein